MRTARLTVWSVACLGAMVVALCWKLGGYPLLEPDEGRNAEIAREAAVQHEWVVPTLDGLPYVDKPILYFAAGAVSIRLFGATPAAARLPSLLFTLATTILLAWFARRTSSVTAAWTAAIAYLTTPFALAYARTVIFDSTLTFFMVGALVALYLAIERIPPPSTARAHPEWYAPLGWACIALGVMTKGPVALALPLMVTVPFAIWRKRVRALFDPVAVLTGVAILLPWLFAISHRVPDFFHYALVVETARRLLTNAMHRSGPWWYFFPILLGAAFPWSVVALAGFRGRTLRRDGAVDPLTVYLLIWIVLPLLLFTFSHSKRPQYILPLVPALALLVARAWEGQQLPGARWGAGVLVTLGTALVTVHGRLGALAGAHPEIAAFIPPTALALGIIAMAAGAAAWLAGWQLHRGGVLLALSVPVIAIPFIALPLLQSIGRERSAAELAAGIAPVASPGTEIVAIHTFPLSLPFYMRRGVVLATEDASELTSNYITEHADQLRRLPTSPLRPADWWRDALLTCTRSRIFVARSRDRETRALLALNLPLIAETGKWSAYGPCSRGTMVALGAD